MESSHKSRSAWRSSVAKYSRPSPQRAIWQLVNTFVPYALLWFLVPFCAEISLWLVLAPAIAMAAFTIRAFIIFHDCGHGSFFASAAANRFWGLVTGLINFTPYGNWRWEHAAHHASSGNLDKRGIGDIWTLTVQEYLASSRWKRFAYRLSRNPFVLFLAAPLFIFFIKHRLVTPSMNAQRRRSVWGMNLGVAVMIFLGMQIFGPAPYLLAHGVAMTVAGSAGIWLFYVQHQFEHAYWEKGESWDYAQAALKGSSYYQLPKVLQWFSGNIGFHHIHHLGPKIPNYYLPLAHESEPLFKEVRPLTLWASFKSLSYRLWDEQSKRLVGFKFLKH